jgi:hypothetical protein
LEGDRDIAGQANPSVENHRISRTLAARLIAKQIAATFTGVTVSFNE